MFWSLLIFVKNGHRQFWLQALIIKTHKLDMRQQKRKKAQVRFEQAEEMRKKNEEATVTMLANSSDNQLSSQSSFSFLVWSNSSFLAMNASIRPILACWLVVYL